MVAITGEFTLCFVKQMLCPWCFCFLKYVPTDLWAKNSTYIEVYGLNLKTHVPFCIVHMSIFVPVLYILISASLPKQQKLILQQTEQIQEKKRQLGYKRKTETACNQKLN